jgi:hypothetical protein
MAIHLPTAAASPPAVVSTTKPETASFDERWAAWLAKGAAHDRSVRRRMAVAAPILLAVAAGVIYVLGR